MFVVTFYSYKGGVGRTMALVNTAALLAKRGRRVLVVDFDLEAPGLPSYELFCSPSVATGVVDYVTSYRATGIAPDAGDYITKCGSDSAEIWLMPAGLYTASDYTNKLNSIDWQELYDEQSGYLMFEDLKQQWSQFEGKGFDYVLIDSRTGHTDVGGICTRQLPDAVVVMFLPNEQNINGLAPIVEGIRSERAKGSKRKIELLFCASNVPDLDDEQALLSGLLEDAQVRLKYKDDAVSVIHHYSSLDILKQTTFVTSRPNSRLSKEYAKLETEILSLNFADVDGALLALNRMPAILDRARGRQDAGTRMRLLNQAMRIRESHPDDGQIAFTAARAFSAMGEEIQELDALTSAIEAGHEVNRARLGRAFLVSASQRRPQALADLTAVMTSPTATVFELSPALRLLQQIDDNWVSVVEPALAVETRDFRTLYSISQIATSDRRALVYVADRMEHLLETTTLEADQVRQAHNLAVISWIGSGRYDRAVRLTEREQPFVAEEANIDIVFNRAIAKWGQSGVAPRELFEVVSRRFSPESADANVNQCIALTWSVLGDRGKSLEAVRAALKDLRWGKSVFSCWRYLNASETEMRQDLTDMEKQLLAGEFLVPPFFSDVKQLFH